MNQLHFREYLPYIPPIKANEIQAAKIVVADMVLRTKQTLENKPSPYMERVLKYWTDRQETLSAF